MYFVTTALRNFARPKPTTMISAVMAILSKDTSVPKMFTLLGMPSNRLESNWRKRWPSSNVGRRRTEIIESAIWYNLADDLGIKVRS
jgi:hypothetical protein